MSGFFEEVPSISPLLFFSEEVPLYKKKECLKRFEKKQLLPNFSHFLDQEDFANIYGSWNEQGLFFFVEVDQPFEDCSFTDFRKKDSVELFIDTRNLKTRRQMTSYCHHFLFLPQEVGGIQGKEITRFRGEETHPIADPKDLMILSDMKKNQFSYSIHIPAFCLHGYDPQRFSKLGFSYQVNRKNGEAQFFNCTEDDFLLEINPHVWSTLVLEDKKD